MSVELVNTLLRRGESVLFYHTGVGLINNVYHVIDTVYTSFGVIYTMVYHFNALVNWHVYEQVHINVRPLNEVAERLTETLDERSESENETTVKNAFFVTW